MAAVSETIVREYFEHHAFFVRQERKYVTPERGWDEGIDFFVVNLRPVTLTTALPFVLSSADLPGIARALVVVKGWHTETFSSSRLAHSPGIFRFLKPQVLAQAARRFGEDGPTLKILVVPALPTSKEGRAQSVELLRSKGIDAVLPFRTILAELIEAVKPNRNYQKSDLLQVLRILKAYDFFKERQLELFRPRRRPKAG